MTSWFQSLIGMAPATAQSTKEEPKSALENVSVEERQASLLKKQRLDLKKNKAELTILNEELQRAIDEGDKAEAGRKLMRVRVLKQDITTLEGQVANQEAAQRTLAAAQTNKEQALLMRDGANRLAAHVDDAERIDVDDIVDTFQDGAQRTHEFSARLSEPIVPASVYALNDDGEGVDEELDRLMQRNAEAKTVGMPSAPAASGGGGGVGVVVPSRPQGGTAQVSKRSVPSQKSLDAIKDKDY